MAKITICTRLPKKQFFLIAVAGIFACWGADTPLAIASVSGACSKCHTMHDSQNGLEYPGSAAGAQAKLLVSSCIACHTGRASDVAERPFVLDDVGEPTLWTQTLAGGNFYWVANGNDAAGHNVDGIAGQDGNIGSFTPPGWSTNAVYQKNVDRSGNGANWGAQLTCADVTGCHGDAAGGIQGTHHSSNNTDPGQYSDDATAGLGDDFRFLKGIKGWEAGDYGLGGDTGDYNVYKGENRYGGGSGYADDVSTDTISYLCAGCHGEFHSADNVGGSNTGVAQTPDGASYGNPWIRHPIDLALSSVGGDYATSYGAYNPKVPLGFTDPSGGPAAMPGDADTGTVTCISCHFAHGGPWDDLLRWDYANYTTGDADDTGEGCFQCHGNKDST